MTVVIRLFTQTWRPDTTVTVRAGPAWDDDITGEFERGAWEFIIDRPPGDEQFEFKFVLDYEVWQDGPNMFAGAPENDFGEDSGRIVFGAADLPDAEFGVVSRAFFQPDLSENVYDVVVVGSGIGGGILADALSDKGARTLVLEAGSMLFPTHIANLPRAHRIGVFDKHVWGLWNNRLFRSTPYMNVGDGSVYGGGYGYNLGGRSIFWGGFTPRMRDYEFETPAWPRSVRDALLDGGYYDEAEKLMKVGPARPSEYQDESKKWLKRELGDKFLVFDAPMGVQRLVTEKRNISAGLFSTADLLFESRTTEGDVGNQNLVVNLNQDVRRVQLDGNRVEYVESYDRVSRELRRFYGRQVVLAAGALESARIAQLSNIGDVNGGGKLGLGITDHQIWFVHFSLPPSSPLFTRDGSSKIVIQHRNPTVTQHGWNAILELGADYNQGRYVDPDILAEHKNARGDNMLCELVFLTASPLLEQNYVRPGQDDDGRPMAVHIEKSRRASVMLPEMNIVKNQILDNLGAEPLLNETTGLALVEAGVGGVAHEVGSCRMSETPADGFVDANLQVHGTENLHVCDLSVFPTSPSANPTLALGALAIRLADKLRP